MMPIVFLLFCAGLCFVVYYFTSRNPGDVRNQHDLDQLDKNPQYNLESKTNQIKRQTEYFGAQHAKVVAIDELEHTGERLKEVEELKVTAHVLAKETADLGIKQAMAAKKLTEVAASKDVDVATHNEIRLEEEKGRIRLADRKVEIDQDIDKADRMATVEIRKTISLAKVTMDTILFERMFDKAVVLDLQSKVFTQVDILEKLVNLPPSASKTFKVEVATGILQGWIKELNGLVGLGEQGDVPGQDRNTNRGLGATPEPPADSGETEEED